MNDDQCESVQIKKNHITNGGMVEKTNDLKTIVKGYSTLISDTYQSWSKEQKTSKNSHITHLSSKNLTQTPTNVPNNKK